MLFLQDGLYLKVDSHNVTNFTRGSWKRSITMFGKVSCRHVGCSVESITFEEMLEHDLNCPMAPKKVNITRCRCKILISHAEVLRSKKSWFLSISPFNSQSSKMFHVAGSTSANCERFICYAYSWLDTISCLCMLY